MATRKPVPSGGSGLAQQIDPPYPITPISTKMTQPFRIQDVHDQMASSGTDTEPNSATAWSGEFVDRQKEPDLPEALRAGPPAGYKIRASQENLGESSNPFAQDRQLGMSDGGESSANAWSVLEAKPPQPSAAPPPPPPPPPAHLDKAPAQDFSSLSVSEPSTNPWQPALDQRDDNKHSRIVQMPRENSGNEAWSESIPKQHSDEPRPTKDSYQAVLIEIPEPESPAWDEDEASPVLAEMPKSNGQEQQRIDADSHVWDDDSRRLPDQGPPPESDLGAGENSMQEQGWNMVHHDPPSERNQPRDSIRNFAAALEIDKVQELEHAPTLPPRNSQEYPPAQPPRPLLEGSENNHGSVACHGSPAAAALRTQKKETYEIKKISWHDVTATQNPRISPILVQNANGPCPLLALVNALTLSTPADVDTALVDTLRSREQVSLGLLLDAVFDELMSGRRGDAAQELPDVSDLYSFLITLHTGMNVNPCFFSPPKSSSPNDPRNLMSHVHPSKRDETVPGTFEDTREMRLYSTFSVPLIHGWIPEADSLAFNALARAAKSYEDAQNILFHEEVLEDKLKSEGLSFEDQARLEDIATIKAFFSSNATQLTPYGLATITKALAPGSVAILFRNDHFSTLYRHPDTLQLLQLVTDMGYAGHEEVVWESLIDVSGENAEFFSGDFRPVGGLPTSSTTSNQAVQPSNNGKSAVTESPVNLNSQQGNQSQTSSSKMSFNDPPQSPNTEQEDHDLALALQLQEEEEERHRNEVSRRRRETELSQQYIEQQGTNNNIPVSQRGSSTRGNSNINDLNSDLRTGSGHGVPESRPPIPPRRSGPNATSRPINPESESDAPPPSYEQAANQAAYVPPSNHPSHPGNNPPGRGRRTSGYSVNTQNSVRGRRTTLVDQIPGRRVSVMNAGQGLSQQQQDERSRDCAIM